MELRARNTGGIQSDPDPQWGVAVFGRDAESSKQVWSSREGYPGDYNYREFYRDVGYDLDLDYIGPYLHPPGLRSDTGIKYYRITGETLAYKEPYRPDIAREKAAEHAGNFMFNRQKQVEFLAKIMSRPPIIVAPYDSELLGIGGSRDRCGLITCAVRSTLIRMISNSLPPPDNIWIWDILCRRQRRILPAGEIKAILRSGLTVPTTGFTAIFTMRPRR